MVFIRFVEMTDNYIYADFFYVFTRGRQSKLKEDVVGNDNILNSLEFLTLNLRNIYVCLENIRHRDTFQLKKSNVGKGVTIICKTVFESVY